MYDIHKGQFSIVADDLSEYTDDYQFSTDETETLNVVIEDYGYKAAFWLSELTHKERPWKETRGNLQLGERSTEVIPKSLIQEYYSGLI